MSWRERARSMALEEERMGKAKRAHEQMRPQARKSR